MHSKELPVNVTISQEEVESSIQEASRPGTDELPPDEIVPFLDNPFLDTFHGHTIVYHRDFYVAMYKKIHDEGMTHVEAYNALGFDTKILGENRAYSVGKRVMKMAEQNRLFTVSPANYDGTVPPEKMGDLAPAERLAYLEARNAYLEEVVEAQKKSRLYWRRSIHPRNTGNKCRQVPDGR